MRTACDGGGDGKPVGGIEVGMHSSRSNKDDIFYVAMSEVMKYLWARFVASVPLLSDGLPPAGTQFRGE